MRKIMKKCMLLFSLYGFVLFSMDGENSPLSLNQKAQQPKTMKILFDCKSCCSRQVPWSSVMPKEIIITPNEEEIVMARGSEVLKFTFIDKNTRFQSTSHESIIKHPHSQYPPKMVVAEAEDKSLVVAS